MPTSDDEMYTTKYLVDLILDGHWSVSKATNDTIWRVFERFGSKGRERLYELPFFSCPDPPGSEIREFEQRLLALEAELIRNEHGHRDAQQNRSQMMFPWSLEENT